MVAYTVCNTSKCVVLMGVLHYVDIPLWQVSSVLFVLSSSGYRPATNGPAGSVHPSMESHGRMSVSEHSGPRVL